VKKAKTRYDSPEKLKNLCSNLHVQFSPALHLVSPILQFTLILLFF
jgi:hypothetical protein